MGFFWLTLCALSILEDASGFVDRPSVAFQKLLQPCRHGRHLLKLALPDATGAPSHSPQLCSHPTISLLVGLNFGEPIVRPRLRGPPFGASMPVPEASVDKDCGLSAGENNVRRAWERARVESVAISAGMKPLPNGHLGPRIAGLDRLHDPATLSRGTGICHLLPS